MKFTLKKLPESKAEINIEVPFEEFDKYYKEALLKMGKDVEVPGFRKGKVPSDVIEGRIGKEGVLAEAAENAVKETYLKAVKESEDKIEALGRPEVQVLKLAPGNPLEFKAVLSIMPEVKLPEYKEIAKKVKRENPEVSEREVEESLEWIQKSKAKFTAKDVSQKGDWVEIKYKQLDLEGKESEDDASQSFDDAFILGEGKLIKGFEENLIGMKANQEKEFSFQKDDSSENLKFWVKMKSVQKMELPELNDDFAKSVSLPVYQAPGQQKQEFENLTALKQALKAGLLKEKRIEEKQKTRQEMLEKISEKTEIEKIPEILIEEQKKKFLENLKGEVSRNLKMSFEDYLKKIQKTEQDMLKTFEEPAEKQVKTSLALREIQKKENIEVSDKEIQEEIEKILKDYALQGIQEKDIDPGRLKSYTKEVIKQEKAFQILESCLQ